MKKLYIFLIVLFLVMGACQRSQFSTTTRKYQNGKVTYINHYSTERTKSLKVTVHKSHLKETEAQNNSIASDRTGVQNLPEPEIATLDPAPISQNENLIASTSDEPSIIAVNDNRIANLYPDTTKRITPSKGTINDSIIQNVIKFKNGKQEVVRIISQSHDTLKYELTSEQGVVRLVMMEQVDTILTGTAYSFKQGKGNTTKETESNEQKYLRYSEIGFIPIVGIPFAIIGIILGARNLRRIRKNLASIKGKKIAQSTVIIGILALIFNIIITIGIFFAIIAVVSSSVSSCASGIVLHI